MKSKTKTKKSSFVYKPRTAEDVKKRAEQTGGKFDSIFKSGIDTFRPKVGENTFRILPPTWEDADHYGFELWVHSYVGPDKSTYLCPKKMLGKACAICDAANEAKEAGEADEAKQLGVSKRLASYIVDRDEEDLSPIVYVYSWSMDRDIATLSQNKRTGKVLLIDHPDHGYDVSFKRVGQGLKTRYIGLRIERDPSPIDDDQDAQDELLAIIEDKPIPSILNYYDNDYLKKVIEGTAEEPEDEEEDDEKPARRGKRSRDEEEDEEENERPVRGSRKRAEPDEEEEDDPPPRRRKPARDEEEEEDDPPPRRKRAAEPEEEEEEEEEPAPRSSKRRAARDEEEEEEEEIPRGRARGPRRDEEEGTGEEEEEEEEEERPRRSSKKRVIAKEPEEEEEEDDIPKRAPKKRR